MVRVWKPLKDPPPARCITGLSSDAELILQALRQAHLNSRHAVKDEIASQPGYKVDYYKHVYTNSFPLETLDSSQLSQHPPTRFQQKILRDGEFLGSQLPPNVKMEPFSPCSTSSNLLAPSDEVLRSDRTGLVPEGQIVDYQSIVRYSLLSSQLSLRASPPLSQDDSASSGEVGLYVEQLESLEKNVARSISSSMPSPDGNKVLSFRASHSSERMFEKYPGEIPSCSDKTQLSSKSESGQMSLRESCLLREKHSRITTVQNVSLSQTTNISKTSSSCDDLPRDFRAVSSCEFENRSTKPTSSNRTKISTASDSKENDCVTDVLNRTIPSLKPRNVVNQPLEEKMRKTGDCSYLSSSELKLSSKGLEVNKQVWHLGPIDERSVTKIVPNFGVKRPRKQKPLHDKKEEIVYPDMFHKNLRFSGTFSMSGSQQSQQTFDRLNQKAVFSYAEKTRISEAFSSTKEVLMTLQYKDRTTQLRENLDDKTYNKRTVIPELDDQAEYLLISTLAGGGHQSGPDGDGCTPVTSLHIPLLSGMSQDEWYRNIVLGILESEGIRKVCFDAQECMLTLIKVLQVDPSKVGSSWLFLDPKVACWLLDPDHPPVTFTEMLTKVFGGRESLLKEHKDKVIQNTLEEDMVLLSSAMSKLYHKLQQKQLWTLFSEVEMPLVPLLAGMEAYGIRVDSKKFVSIGIVLQRCMTELEADAYKAAGHPFQINSHVQLRQILFEELKLDQYCKGQKLARTSIQNLKSTSESVLTKLQDYHNLPKIVLGYRKIVKLKSTYVDGFLDCVVRDHIHCSWEQTSASSGRLQAANPNVQNIPKQAVEVKFKSDENKDGLKCNVVYMRAPFVSKDGCSFVAADFQSIELRLLAHFSHDAVLLKIFRDKTQEDIFVQLTSDWLGMERSEVKPEDREKTKRIVYSVIYGVGTEKLGETLAVSKDQARSFMKIFLEKFPSIKKFSQQCINSCRLHGYVQTVLKRRRLIPAINSHDVQQRLHAERQAVNFVIQGSAADVCKVAMVQVDRNLSLMPHLKARLLVQIHDELLYEVPDEQLPEVKGVIKSSMEAVTSPPINLLVPFPVSISVGKSWGHLQGSRVE